MRTRRALATLLTALACVVLAVPSLVHAGGPFTNAAGVLTNTIETTTGGDYPKLNQVVGDIINAALALLGVIFLVLSVYAGYLWMTARGESDQIDNAKKTLIAAIIGLAITLSAYAISIYVVTKLTGAAGVE